MAYRETSFYDKVGLQFSWSRYYDGTTNGDSALNEGDDRSVYDSHSAVLMASQSGTMNLVVRSIPGTTVKSRGYKRITVTDELLYGSELALSVAGPGTVLESASATFNANVINTGKCRLALGKSAPKAVLSRPAKCRHAVFSQYGRSRSRGAGHQEPPIHRDIVRWRHGYRVDTPGSAER